jgi:hypothetical protein
MSVLQGELSSFPHTHSLRVLLMIFQCLITEGVKFHVNSNVISIPAESSMFPATLTGRPLEPGVLRIIGNTSCFSLPSTVKDNVYSERFM